MEVLLHRECRPSSFPDSIAREDGLRGHDEAPGVGQPRFTDLFEVFVLTSEGWFGRQQYDSWPAIQDRPRDVDGLGNRNRPAPSASHSC
jgi:hypothetical protein